MPRERTITLAGNDYVLRYDLRVRREAEKKLGKGLYDALRDGLVETLATLIWAGIKHTNRKLTVDDVFDQLVAHQEGGGEYDPILKECLRAMCEAGIFGKQISSKEIARLLGEEEQEQGKVSAPLTVRAAE